MSKGSGRRPENAELVRANWDAIFGKRQFPQEICVLRGIPDMAVPLGEWHPHAEIVDAANGSDPL